VVDFGEHHDRILRNESARRSFGEERGHRSQLRCDISAESRVRARREGESDMDRQRIEPVTEASLTGLRVLDAHLESVGKVSDVIYDGRDLRPRWAVVKTGFVGGEHCVPLNNTYVADRGELVVPFDKFSIKRSPRVHRDHVLSPRLEHELRDYYGIAA
jgi:PRC-barrel domain